MSNNKLKALKAKTVGIAGCGGLGSNCAVSLARVGIGKLIIADFDIITEGNLNRQYYFFDQIGLKKASTLKSNILRINPKIEVEAHDIKLNPDSIIKIFKNCDIIIEAFDLAEMKQMIIETVITKYPEKPIICGNGIAGWGKNNTIRTEQFGNLFICGDQGHEVSEEYPPLAPKVAIVSNMQANLALEILLTEKS